MWLLPWLLMPALAGTSAGASFPSAPTARRKGVAVSADGSLMARLEDGSLQRLPSSPQEHSLEGDVVTIIRAPRPPPAKSAKAEGRGLATRIGPVVVGLGVLLG
ncbi:unnamed protein product, partial [Polarella glacialis]